MNRAFVLLNVIAWFMHLPQGLSHDLRNTLTGARLAIQLHEKECNIDTESIAVAMRQLRLAEDQLMRWLRLGGESESTECLPLSAILDRAVELVRPLMDHHRTRLAVARATELESVLFPQAELLTSAILNLLLNAIQLQVKRVRLLYEHLLKVLGFHR